MYRVEVLGGGLNKIWLIKLVTDAEHLVKRVQHQIKVVSVLYGGMLVADRVLVLGIDVSCGIKLIILKLQKRLSSNCVRNLTQIYQLVANFSTCESSSKKYWGEIIVPTVIGCFVFCG